MSTSWPHLGHLQGSCALWAAQEDSGGTSGRWDEGMLKCHIQSMQVADKAKL